MLIKEHGQLLKFSPIGNEKWTKSRLVHVHFTGLINEKDLLCVMTRQVLRKGITTGHAKCGQLYDGRRLEVMIELKSS